MAESAAERTEQRGPGRAKPRLPGRAEASVQGRVVIPALVPPEPARDATAMDAMDAMDALDASAERNVELVAQVRPEQWNDPTPCAEWNVRTLVGHLIAGRHGYCAMLQGAPATKVRSMIALQSEAAGADPVMECESAVRSVRAAFAEPGALERTVHHRMGDIPGSLLLVLLIGDSVVHSWDLATAIGVDPGLDERLVEFAYGNYVPIAESGAIYANGWFAVPTTPLPEDATPLERLIQLTGR